MTAGSIYLSSLLRTKSISLDADQQCCGREHYANLYRYAVREVIEEQHCNQRTDYCTYCLHHPCVLPVLCGYKLFVTARQNIR